MSSHSIRDTCTIQLDFGIWEYKYKVKKCSPIAFFGTIYPMNADYLLPTKIYIYIFFYEFNDDYFLKENFSRILSFIIIFLFIFNSHLLSNIKSAIFILKCLSD